MIEDMYMEGLGERDSRDFITMSKMLRDLLENLCCVIVMVNSFYLNN